MGEEQLARVFDAQDSADRDARMTEYGFLLDHIGGVGLFEREFGASLDLSYRLTDKLQRRLAKYHRNNDDDPMLESETWLLFMAADTVNRQRVGQITPEMHRDLALLSLSGENKVMFDDLYATYPAIGELEATRLVTRRQFGRIAVLDVMGSGRLALKQRIARDMANAGVGEYAAS